MPDQNTTPDLAAAPRRARRAWFRVAAVLVGLAPLVALEIALRLLDVARPAAADPAAGFGAAPPLFERQGDVWRTARARAPFIAPQEFPAEKPRGGRRAFFFGGSTVFGHPYLGDTAFPKWLELELAARDPARAWQAINCGGISYASYRIAPMVREVLRHQPDLIVVATGHNEFLEDRTYHVEKNRSALGAWLRRRAAALHTLALARRIFSRENATPSSADPAGDAALTPHVNTRLDYESGYASYRRDEGWERDVAAQYEESLHQIVADCWAAGVPLLLVRLGSNLRDCPPYKSEHRAGLPPTAETDWQAAFDVATATEKTDPARALRLYQEAAAIDGEHALLNFRIARLLDRLGRAAEARAFFERARDTDICPLRITAPLERALLSVARETATPLVDAAAVIAARCPDGLAGNDWYVDHVHPTIGGHQLIARTIAAELHARDWVAGAADWPEAARVKTYAAHLATLGPAYFADGRRRVGWLENWAKRQKLAAETLPVDAAGFARLAFRRLDLGEEDSAWAALAEALQRDRATEKLVRARAQQLVAEGRAAAAEALLRRLE
ncbi:MAG: hypothetical protein RLZZ15_3641 [Verrucomicrobiota bacterium]